MTPANDDLCSLNVGQLEIELAILSNDDLRAAGVDASPADRTSDIIAGEFERRGIDL